MSSMKKFRIAVLGIGGVGGYIGAKLALYYENSHDVEVAFVCRGAHEGAIREKGLRLITPDEEMTVRPAVVSSKASVIGVVDLLICCIKSYDLESSLGELKSSIGPGTVILPLLNGVDGPERIRKQFPGAEVWEGCIYIVSRLTAPGVVTETGNIHKLFFGADKGDAAKLLQAEALFVQAGMDAHLSPHIVRTNWEKFHFISTIATLTSFLNKSIGEILADVVHKKMLEDLMDELRAVAGAKGIDLPNDIAVKALERMASLPFDTTSSMHSDFKRGGRTELESLTGYVVREAKAAGVNAPLYEMMYEVLKAGSK